ncbi:MAG TPA: twin-arginine translocase subunit TatC [Saprospiraceae bacterium]|nr:twin-arginine translocase subunit TatC [Saprospiraceae bacterium]
MLPFLNKVKSPNDPAHSAEMSFLDHFDALRKHLFRIALWVTVGTIFVFIQKKFVFDQIIFGPLNKNFITYRIFCGISEFTCFDPGEIKVITRELSEQLTVHLKVSFFLGIVLVFPFCLNEIWKFVKPGLYQKEINATTGLIAACSFLFVLGILFGYYIIAPFSISFLASYGVSDRVENTTTLTSIVDNMTMFTLSTGAVFELPVLVYFLAKLGIMSAEFMRTYRRHAIVVIVIVAAVITPPDVSSMIMVSIPLLLLYELSILIAKKVYPKSEF